MKQVLQSLKNGQIEVTDVPCPQVRAGHLLIQSRATLISAGTERTMVEFGKSSLLAKARSHPDKVKQVLAKIKVDGLLPTLEMVFARLDEPFPLGYCNAGVVVEVGSGVEGFEVGDRVVSNGPHAEMVCVPQSLCAKVPDDVADEEAAFAVLGAIGLQGIRLVAPTIGEAVVVTGLGLIGLLTAQMLLANGCRVLGIDPDPKRSELAREMGLETINLSAGADPVVTAIAFSRGRGVDGVVITAAATTNRIMKESAQMCRKRGRIVLVGVVGLELSRAEFYEKELTFQVSCSYGPGRYDQQYEECGQDYPIGFVRWTEQRNFEAVLELLAAHRLDVSSLISDRIDHTRAADAYKILTENRKALGIILTYPQSGPPSQTVVALPASKPSAAAPDGATVGVIGAGEFARMLGLPVLARTGARLSCIADLDGAVGAHVGRKFGFERTTTSYHSLLDDPKINAVFIFTRHDQHASMVVEALKARKHVFVEKPLCLNADQLDLVRRTYERSAGLQLVVGFNRRFSPHAVKMKSLLASRTQPICMSMMVNAGVIPKEHWVHDPDIGGGRIIGEGCHWVDLMSFLAGGPVTRVVSTRVGDSPGLTVRDDKATITLSFADGSVGTIHYFANGHKAYPKETMELFCDGKVLRLDNFRILRGQGWLGFRQMKLRRVDKGHRDEFTQFIDAVALGDRILMPFGQVENVMLAAMAAVNSARLNEPVILAQPC
jgi:predicted dehydrogenase/threonine dehydrogenase-like Zn-dependent dehydrogenase